MKKDCTEKKQLKFIAVLLITALLLSPTQILAKGVVNRADKLPLVSVVAKAPDESEIQGNEKNDNSIKKDESEKNDTDPGEENDKEKTDPPNNDEVQHEDENKDEVTDIEIPENNDKDENGAGNSEEEGPGLEEDTEDPKEWLNDEIVLENLELLSDVWDGSVASGFAGGTGMSTDPYLISYPAQLAYLAEMVNSGTNYSGRHFKLTNDIVLNRSMSSPIEWVPIGSNETTSRRFAGTFIGDGYSVYGLYIDSNRDYQGLFGYVTGTIRDLSIQSGSIVGGNYVGSIAGFGDVVFRNCENYASVAGNNYVGGIVGSGREIEDCKNYGDVSGASWVGGISGQILNGGSIIGFTLNATGSVNTGNINGIGNNVGGITGAMSIRSGNTNKLENCQNHGQIQSEGNNVGGLVGFIANSVTLTGAKLDNTGNVTGTNQVGGLIGSPAGGSISYGNNSGTVVGNDYVGGIAGTGTLTISDSQNESVITGNDYVGGIAGKATKITDCGNESLVSGRNYVGGIVGISSGTIENCTKTRQVTGEDYVGGYVGGGDSTIRNCENGVPVSGNNYVGGIAGSATYIEDCLNYGDIEGISWIGGISGQIYYGGKVGGYTIYAMRSINAGNVIGTGNNIGGITGSMIIRSGNMTKLEDCQNGGQIQGDGANTGGLVGSVVNSNSLTATRVSNTGVIVGNNQVGGIVGSSAGGTISEAYSSGVITGINYVGGLAGTGTLNIVNSHNDGDVIGNLYFGGIAGKANKIENCYSVGNAFQPDAAANGLLGVGTNIINCYVLVDSAAGTNPYARTSDQLKQRSTFESWDFADVWFIEENEDYPKLRWTLEFRFKILLEMLKQAGVHNFLLGLTECSSDPVDLATGNFIYENVDLEIAGAFPLQFVRFYNTIDEFEGNAGYNWHHNYETVLRIQEDGSIHIVFNDGHLEEYVPGENGTYFTDPGNHNLLKAKENGYVLQKKDQSKYTFDPDGNLVETTDRNGNRTTYSYENGVLDRVSTDSGSLSFAYNDQGRIGAVETSDGREVSYAYDNGNLSAFTDVNGYETTYAYDELGRLESITNQLDHTTVFNLYDEEYRTVKQLFPDGGEMLYGYEDDVTVLTEQNGNVIIYHRDDKNRIVQTEYVDGSIRKVFDENNNLVRFTDKNGNAWEYEYDERGNRTKETDPMGSTTIYEYNAFNQVTLIIREDGAVTDFSYDEHGNLTSNTDPMGAAVTFVYNEVGLPVQMVNARGYASDTVYDEKGNPIISTDAMGNVTSYEYDEANRLIKIVEPDGREANYTYTASGKPKTVTNALGYTEEYFYDEVGNLIKFRDFNGNETQYTYNAMNYLIAETDASGGITTYVYDQMWNVVETIYPDGTSNHYRYNSLNQLIEEVDGEGNVTRYSYDANGNLTSVADALGNETVYSYDLSNRLIRETLPNGASSGTEYDSVSNVTAITDFMGNRTAFEYDLNDRMVKKTDPLGFVYRYTYDENGNTLTVTDPQGAVTSYEYDPLDRVTAFTSPRGGRTEYSYDSCGNIVREKDPEGGEVLYEYNLLGQVVRLIDAKGGVTSFTYDKNGNQTKIVDPQGNEVVMAYDELNRMVSITDSLGAETSYGYTANGYTSSVTEANGATTAYEYDRNGNLLKETNALGESLSYTFDALGNLIETTNGLGNSKTFTYDTLGRLISAADYNGNQTLYTYDFNNQVTSVTDALDNVTSYDYDAAGNLISVTDAKGNRIQFEYDFAGRVVKTVNALGTAFRYVYDEEGREIERYDGKGNLILQVEYDLLGRPLTQTDALGNTWENVYGFMNEIREVLDALNQASRYEYDAMNRLTVTEDREGNVSKMSYDSEGNLLTITDANGNTTAFSYDDMGRLVQETSAAGGELHYAYNQIHQMTVLTNGRGEDLTYTYNEQGRLLEGAGIAYTYDANGNVLTLTNEAGTAVYEYDARNRPVTYQDIYGNVIAYTYDEIGNLVSLVYPDGKEVTYTYDTASRLASVTDYANRTTSYDYDENGNVTAVKYPNGAVETFTYDAAGQILKAETLRGSTLITSREYLYDGNGNIVEEQGEEMNLHAGYDRNGQLISQQEDWSSGRQDAYTFQYDAAGNMLLEDKESSGPNAAGSQTVMTYGQSNQLLFWNEENAGFDEDGNMVRGPLNGSLANYQYDALNQLVTAGETTYAYDGHGNRVKMKQGDLVTTYAVNPNAELSQLLVAQSSEGIATYYVYGLGLISQEAFYDSESGAGSGKERQYRLFHQDYRGSTIAMTDEDGTITDRIAYSAFGTITSREGDTDTAFLYTGKWGVETDENGLLYMRARYYNPEIKRFINEDPIRDGLNWYTYVANSPLVYIDPTGYLRAPGFHDGVWYENPDAAEFGESSDTYQILIDLGNRWQNTESSDERQRYSDMAEAARYMERRETPFKYGQDEIWQLMNDNVAQFNQKIKDSDTTRAYFWYVNATCNQWDYKMNSDWQIPYKRGNPSDDRGFGAIEDLDEVKKNEYYSHSQGYTLQTEKSYNYRNWVPWIYFEGEIISADKLGNINLGYVGKSANYVDWSILNFATGDKDDGPYVDWGMRLAQDSNAKLFADEIDEYKKHLGKEFENYLQSIR